MRLKFELINSFLLDSSIAFLIEHLKFKFVFLIWKIIWNILM